MEYKEILLDDLVEVYVDNRGKTCPIVDEGDSYLPLIATNCITDDLYPQFSKVRYVDKPTYDNWFRAHPQPNDIIFVNKGTPGGTALVPKKVNFCFAQDMVGLRIKQEYSTEYVFAVLRSSLVRRRIEAMQVGTMIPHFKKGDFKNLYLPIPRDLKMQQKIGKFHLDILKKININKNIISNLERLAQTLFKRWFVDFEFPNETGEPYKSSGGELVESELGVIPKGWAVELLGNISEIQNGFAFKSGDYTDAGIKVLRTLNIHRDGLIINNVDLKHLPYSFYYDKKYKNQRLEKFDSLLVMVGATIGKLGMVLSSNIPSLQNQNMWRFRAKKEKLSNTLLYFHLKNTVEESINWRSGSAREFFRKDSFSKIPIVMPSDSILIWSREIFEHIFNEIDILNSQVENLQNLRDTLLPKLLSGEIELPDETEVTEHVSIS